MHRHFDVLCHLGRQLTTGQGSAGSLCIALGERGRSTTGDSSQGVSKVLGL